jgi:hypothetical protein
MWVELKFCNTNYAGHIFDLWLQVPEILHSLPAGEVFRMRQQTQLMWDLYLSSVRKIVHTTLGKSQG